MVEQGQLKGLALAHPNGGPRLALRLDPERARAAAGFDYFAIGVPDKEAIDKLAARLTAQGEQHAGVHWASIGWILPLLCDPDGHEVRFYTQEHHTEPEPGQVTTIHDPRETAERHEVGTDDPAAAERFYGDVFGWTVSHDDTKSTDPAYQIFTTGNAEGLHGGLFATKGKMPGYAVFTVLVEDVGATCRLAEQAGGQVQRAPEVNGRAYSDI